jgi:two-component system NtrC family sensor kinase
VGTEATRHLLIVDDEPVILQILSAVFEDEPWRVTTAASGAEALRVMNQDPVDILLTDKNLPDISGLELLKAARQLNDLSEVIIITGYASLETALTALELDAFDYVLKPLNNVFEIVRKVQRAAEKQSFAIENRRLIKELSEKNAALERALEETRQLQSELIQSEKLAGIGTLASGIAHEVSSPLFGILGLGEAILEEDDMDTIREHASDIVEYSNTIRDIVVELSSYSRASSSEYLTTVELSRVIEDAVRLVNRSISCEGVTFELNVRDNLYVNARTSEVQQIFVNLVKNAVEAILEAGDAGTIKVESGREHGIVWVRVADDGPGIPEDTQGLVFDPFYTTKAPGKGTGLGLNIVYRIVTKYQGHISVQSRQGEGTVFKLTFPSPE